MPIPTTEQELDALMQKMQSLGAPKEDQRAIIDAFVERQATQPSPPSMTDAFMRGGVGEEIRAKSAEETGVLEALQAVGDIVSPLLPGNIAASVISAPVRGIPSGIEKAKELREGRKEVREARAATVDDSALGKINKFLGSVEEAIPDPETIIQFLGLPLTHTLGEAIAPTVTPLVEAGAAVTKEVTPEPIKEQAVESLTKLSEFWDSLPLETQQSLKDTAALGEIFTTLIPSGAIAKQPIKEGLEQLGEFVVKQKDTLVHKIEPKRASRANKILNSVNKVDPNKQLMFQDLSAGDDIGTFLLKRDIVGPPEKTVELLTKRFTEAKTRLDDALAQVTGTYKPPVVKTVLDDMLDFYTSTANRAGINLTKKRLAKLEEAGLSLSEINSIKREFERKVRLGYLKENNAIKVERNTNLDTALREFRDAEAAKAGFVNIKDLSKEIQLTKFAADAIGDKFKKQLANNQFSLTDNLLLVGGAIEPGSLAVLGIKKIASLPKVQAALVKALKTDNMSPLKELDVVPQRIIRMKNKQKQTQAYKAWLEESGWADLMRFTNKDAQELLPLGEFIEAPEFKPQSIVDIEAVRGE